MRFIAFGLAFLLSPILSLHAQKPIDDSKTAALFDSYIQQSMPNWKVPGLSIIVVKNSFISQIFLFSVFFFLFRSFFFLCFLAKSRNHNGCFLVYILRLSYAKKNPSPSLLKLQILCKRNRRNKRPFC